MIGLFYCNRLVTVESVEDCTVGRFWHAKHTAGTMRTCRSFIAVGRDVRRVVVRATRQWRARDQWTATTTSSLAGHSYLVAAAVSLSLVKTRSHCHQRTELNLPYERWAHWTELASSVHTPYFCPSTLSQSLYLWLAFSCSYSIFPFCWLTTLTIDNSLTLLTLLLPV